MSGVFTIAEIGNNHFGCITKAKELIHAAKYAGASAVKGQIFDANHLRGSMPAGFYKDCAKIFLHLGELFQYAKKIEIPLFFSFFNNVMPELEKTMELKKVSATQSVKIFNEYEEVKTWDIDQRGVFISIPDTVPLPILKNAVVMHVSGYLTDEPDLERLDAMHNFYSSISDRIHPFLGYSDHTEGIEACTKAVIHHGAKVIEKHFTLEKNMDWKGHIFRDTIHGATPAELKQLTTRYL